LPLNVPEQLSLDQAQSDYASCRHLSRRNVCHRLHYLQMCTGKLAKAYFWRSGVTPGFSHYKFVPLLRALDARADFHLMFGYTDSQRFTLQKPAIFDLVHFFPSRDSTATTNAFQFHSGE
jgi:hypothetical protein